MYIRPVVYRMVLCMCFYASVASAQSTHTIITKVDSLLNVLKQATQDNEKMLIHLELAKLIINGHQSLKYAKQSLQLATQLQNKSKMADAYIEIGNDYNRTNDPVNAAQAIFAASTLYESIGDQQGYGVSLNMLGQLYFNQSDYARSITYFRKAIALHTTHKDSVQLADDYNNLGEVYRVEGSYDTALTYFVKARDIYQRKKYKAGIAYSLGNIGLVWTAKQQREKAETKLSESTRLLTQLNDFYPIAVFNIEMAKLSAATGDSHTAVKRALTGYKLALKEGLKEQIRDAAWVLYTIYTDDHDAKQAMPYLHLYYQYKDSLLNEQTIQKIADLQTDYQVAQKEEQLDKLTIQNKKNVRIAILLAGGLVLIAILSLYLFRLNKKMKLTNGILTTQREQLEYQNTIIQENLNEKEVLLKEIHHRVKNNLQIISSLLSLQSNTLVDSGMIEVFQTGQSRIQSIALIHQKLYQNEGFTLIPIQEYIEQLAVKIMDTILAADTEVDVQVHASDVLLDIDTAVPLGLIVNELITNSIKYAFTERKHGQITIQIVESSQNGYTLHYSDSGWGLPEGIQLASVSTLGSKLIYILTRQLGGQLDYFNDKGAHFVIRFYDMVKRKELA